MPNPLGGLQKVMAKMAANQKVQSALPKAPPPAAEILKPDLMRVYSGQREPIEGKFDISRADPHASMGRAFYTAELPRYANKFTGNQPGANVTPVDVDRNRMLMFDKMYETPQGQMEGLDYYDMLRRQAMAKPGVGKDMIRKEILDAGFAGTQMPNATGKAYAIYDTSAAQDMSGQAFREGGLAMASGGLARARRAANAAFKALPGESFQGKTGTDMPSDVERRIMEINRPNLVLPSEALGKHEGKTLMITQADRTKVGEGFLGGPGFSSLQLTDPRYAEAAWGVKTPGVAQTIAGSNRRVPEGQAIWTTMLGTPHQHKSNQMVFDRLYKEFMGGIKQEKLSPELKDTLNTKLASVVDKEGKNLFPEDVDITNPRKFRKLVDTFDKRAAAADVMGGIGVGGKKGQIFDYDRIIQRTTDPALLDTPTGSLGNRLFQLSGEVMDRPDLHPAFPTILKGEDLGVNFTPAPRELLMEDFINKVLTEKGRQPGYMDWTRGYAPSQFLSEGILTKLQKAGYKRGGRVK